MSARGDFLGPPRTRPASRVGLVDTAPYRTARLMTPETTVRHVLAVDTPRVVRTTRRKSSTLDVVTSRSRNSLNAGPTWFFSCSA